VHESVEREKLTGKKHNQKKQAQKGRGVGHISSLSSLYGSGPYHLMELQFQLRGLMEVRDGAHDFYAKIRGVLPQSAVDTVIDRLTCNTTLDLGITKDEWNHCLGNPQVRAILDELGIDEELRKDIIEYFDSDGSGQVTTAELHAGLLMCRDPPRAHELLEVRLKIREMQQWLRTRLKPELQGIRRGIKTLESGDPGANQKKADDVGDASIAVSETKFREDKKIFESGAAGDGPHLPNFVIVDPSDLPLPPVAYPTPVSPVSDAGLPPLSPPCTPLAHTETMS